MEELLKELESVKLYFADGRYFAEVYADNYGFFVVTGKTFDQVVDNIKKEVK